MRFKKTKAQTLRACFSIFKIKSAEGFQYRLSALSGVIVGAFWVLLDITIFSIFYKYSENSNAGLLAGISLKQLASYVWLGQMLWVIQPMGIDAEIKGKIISGDIAVELCRPLDLYFHWYAKTAGSKIVQLVWRGFPQILIAMIVPGIYRISPPASIEGFMLMILSAVVAFFLCSSFGMLITAVRVNITWGEGPTYIMMLVGGVLSGNYFPLQLWPDFLQKFLLIQPFAGYLDIPLRLYIGTMLPSEAITGIGLQVFWTVLFTICGKLLMTGRLKKVIIQGG